MAYISEKWHGSLGVILVLSLAIVGGIDHPGNIAPGVEGASLLLSDANKLPPEWRDVNAAKKGAEKAAKQTVLSRSTIGPDSVPGNPRAG